MIIVILIYQLNINIVNLTHCYLFFDKIAANQNEKKLEDESPYENLNNFGFPINSSNRNSTPDGNPYVCIEQYLGFERKEGFNESES